MTTKKTLGIVGARGHTGAELIRLVASHPHLELAFVSSRELAGESVAGSMPSSCLSTPSQTARRACCASISAARASDVAAASDAQGLIDGAVRTGLRDRPRSSARHGHCPPCRGWIELRESAG